MPADKATFDADRRAYLDGTKERRRSGNKAIDCKRRCRDCGQVIMSGNWWYCDACYGRRLESVSGHELTENEGGCHIGMGLGVLDRKRQVSMGVFE